MFVYVGCRTTRERGAQGRGIEVFAEDDGGRWRHVETVGDLVNPSFLTLDRTGRTLYAVHGDRSEASAFARDPKTGRLSFLGRGSTGGRNPVHLALDPTGRWLITVNYATGTVASLPVDDGGALGPPAHLLDVPGEIGPHRVEQAGAHPHHCPFDPGGRFIVVPDKGLDRVFVLGLDVATGTLALADPGWVATREAAGPRHVAFHPGRPFAFVANELDSTVTTYGFDAERGTLTPLFVVPTLPREFTANNRVAGIVTGADGSTIYVSNRGHDSVAVLACDPDSGALSPRSWRPSGGTTPRFITLDPRGTTLHVANETSHTVVSFPVDPRDGSLGEPSRAVETGSPTCIVFASPSAS
ncbi:lactonase family protein [Acuticoccus sp.]|uniref:lactonase family protein n=1 Tax=Acuticoccus sp. TaxID=1904378 RepID=UPI003B521AD4